jgi:hypothetical protein
MGTTYTVLTKETGSLHVSESSSRLSLMAEDSNGLVTTIARDLTAEEFMDVVLNMAQAALYCHEDNDQAHLHLQQRIAELKPG